MKVELRGRHDLGQIVGYAYRLYARNFTPFFLVAAITIPGQLLIGVIQQGSSSDGAQTAAALLNIPAAIVGLIATAALIFAVHDATGGTAPDFGRSLDAAFERFGAMFKTSLRAGVIAILALAAAPALGVYWLFRPEATIDGRRNWWLSLVPGVLFVYLAVRWVFIQQSVMIEGRRGWPAMDESAGLVRGTWWRTLGVLAIVALIEVGTREHRQRRGDAVAAAGVRHNHQHCAGAGHTVSCSRADTPVLRPESEKASRCQC